MQLKHTIIFWNEQENILRKGENAGYHHFLLFPQCFQKDFFSGFIKVGTVWERVQDPEEKCFLKTLWEKENMILTSIFSFFQSVSYPIKGSFII